VIVGVEGCRLRIGDWRAIYTLKNETVTVIRVGHRREVYGGDEWRPRGPHP